MKEQIMTVLKSVKPGMDFNEEFHLVYQGILSSLEIIQLIMGLEQTFGVKIPVTEILPENFDTPSAIETMINRLSGK